MSRRYFIISMLGSLMMSPLGTLAVDQASSSSLDVKQSINCQKKSSDQCLSKPITAVEAAKQMGKGFNLGQMFDNNQHAATLEEAKPKIDAYYAKGFRNVRIPVTWTENIGGVVLADPDTGKINRDLDRLKHLKTVVDYALSLPDMYVVLNAHHEKKLKDDNNAAALEQLWSDINELFKDRDHRLIFEVLNEPHLSDTKPMPPENLRHMTALVYAKIRASDPFRILVIGGNQWFAASEMAATWPNLNLVGGGKDQYLMATFHHYNPWTFHGDHQGDYADPWTEADLSGPMDTMLEWSKSVGQGMPIYISEWGTGWQSTLKVMNCNNIRLWFSEFDSKYASIKGIPNSVWDDGGWFELFDQKTKSFNNNLVDCIGGACKWDGKERFNSGCK